MSQEEERKALLRNNLKGYFPDGTIDLMIEFFLNPTSGSAGAAIDVSFNNLISGLAADNVQDAIDEIVPTIQPPSGITEVNGAALINDNTGFGVTNISNNVTPSSATFLIEYDTTGGDLNYVLNASSQLGLRIQVLKVVGDGFVTFTSSTGKTFNGQSSITFKTGAILYYNATANDFRLIVDKDVPDPTIIRVNQTEGVGDFTDIALAIDSITDSSVTKPYLIELGAGIWVLSSVLTLPPYVSVKGAAINSTIIDGDEGDCFQLSQGCEISFLTIRNSGVAISCIDVGDFAQLHKITIYGCYNPIFIKSTSVDSYVFIEYVDINGLGWNGVRVESENGFVAFVNLENFYGYDLSYTDTVFATGTAAEVQMLVGSIQSINGGMGVHCQNGAVVGVDTFTIHGYDFGVESPNVGVGGYISLRSIYFKYCTTDIRIQNPNTSVSVSGILDKSKLDINVDSQTSGTFTDIVSGETIILGKLFYGQTNDNIYDLSTYINQNGTLGVYEGGQISVSSGLTIAVSTGFGYLEMSDENITRLDWTGETLLLPASESNYIYINESGILSYSSSAPNNRYNILLGKVNTNATGIESIEDSELSGYHYINHNDELLRNGIGAIFHQGGIVAESATPLRVDVTAASYYFGTKNLTSVGGSEIEFIQKYQDGLGGYNDATTQDIDATNYDNGSGTLEPLSNNHYVKHSLYLLGGTTETYYLVLGRAEYTNFVDVQTADIATPPSYFNEAIVLIANIIVQEGNPNIVEIQDSRPIVGFRSPTTTGASNHGDLLGLSSDDHLQYLLVNGGRAMSGTLNMGGNPITNVGLINSINLASHVSRHVPNGSDPLPTGSPVTISDSTNSDGIENTFARADHGHSHGNRGGGSLHAVVTTLVNGFMSFADKVKLDGFTATFTSTLKTAYDNVVTWISTNGTDILNHISNTSNPHSVTKAQVGLGSVVDSDTTTTANITDSTNKRFVTDANLVVIGNTSGTNTGDNAVNSLYSGLATSKQDVFSFAMLSATQTNNTTTPTVLTSHTFTIPAGKTAIIEGNFIFTSTQNATGALYGIRVAQAAGANGNAQGSCFIDVNVSSIISTGALTDGDVFNVAANANSIVSVTGGATTAGNNAARLKAIVRNLATNVSTTVTIEFASENAGQTITAQIGTAATITIN